MSDTYTILIYPALQKSSIVEKYTIVRKTVLDLYSKSSSKTII